MTWLLGGLEEQGEDGEGEERRRQRLEEEEEDGGFFAVVVAVLLSVPGSKCRQRKAQWGQGKGCLPFLEPQCHPAETVSEKPRQQQPAFCQAQGSARTRWVVWALPKPAFPPSGLRGLEGSVPDGGTQWGSRSSRGPGDTAPSPNSPAGRCFPVSHFGLGPGEATHHCLQGPRGTFPVVSFLGNSAVPCLGPRRSQEAPFLTGSGGV